MMWWGWKMWGFFACQRLSWYVKGCKKEEECSSTLSDWSSVSCSSRPDISWTRGACGAMWHMHVGDVLKQNKISLKGGIKP